MKRNPDTERGLDTKTPEPPPPPTRMTYPPNTIKEPEAEFPPPPESDTKSKLSEESVGQLSEENKENIVKQWVESTTQSAEDIAKELEKFAYDIAETVVSNMEKNSEKKDSYGTHSHQSVATTSSVEQSQKTHASSGIYFAAPAATTRHELHGPVYVQEENRRVGMTFQQEERRREELRKEEEAKQEEKRRFELELEAQRLQEEQQRKLFEMQQAQEQEMRRKEEARIIEMQKLEQQRKLFEMQQAQEEEMRRKEEAKRIEMEKQAIKKQEEDRKHKAEMERQAEERKQLEEMRRVEEQRLKQQELMKIEEEKKRQEILRFEQLKHEEELKRQEEMRLEQEMRRQFEMKQQMESQRHREEQMLLEQQQILQQQKEKELQEAHSRQESMSVRDHIPKLTKTKSFVAAQDRKSETQHEDHLSSVKTGQVNEKRNFWIRSTSADRLNQVSLSPAPRRRRIDWNANRQKENDDLESRPGSSLGQAATNTGSVKNLSSGFIAKSKSSAAVMQDEFERGRPKQKTVIANGWTKEQYDQKVNQDFLKSQEVKTNKVTETVQTWGKRDSSATGRTTPAPSRNIGEAHAENRVGKTAEVDKNANSWRTKTPEPTLKLVNVSVEKAIGSNQNIHISENAHKQMASFMASSTMQQKEESTVMTNTMSSQSSITSHSMSTTSRCSLDNNFQPPPTPERNQSYGVAVRYLSQ